MKGSQLSSLMATLIRSHPGSWAASASSKLRKAVCSQEWSCRCVNIYELASWEYAALMAVSLHGCTAFWLTDSPPSLCAGPFQACWARRCFHTNLSSLITPWEPTAPNVPLSSFHASPSKSHEPQLAVCSFFSAPSRLQGQQGSDHLVHFNTNC